MAGGDEQGMKPSLQAPSLDEIVKDRIRGNEMKKLRGDGSWIGQYISLTPDLIAFTEGETGRLLDWIYLHEIDSIEAKFGRNAEPDSLHQSLSIFKVPPGQILSCRQAIQEYIQ